MWMENFPCPIGRNGHMCRCATYRINLVDVEVKKVVPSLESVNKLGDTSIESKLLRHHTSVFRTR